MNDQTQAVELNLWLDNQLRYLPGAAPFARVPLSDYADMKSSAHRDWKLALAQLFNLVNVAMTFLGKMMAAVPLLLFWAYAYMALYSPAVLVEILQEIQKSDLAAISGAARASLATAIPVAAVLLGGAEFMQGRTFGFRNVYEEAVYGVLRHTYSIPRGVSFYVTSKD
jgi:hypothetical protein